MGAGNEIAFYFHDDNFLSKQISVPFRSLRVWLFMTEEGWGIEWTQFLDFPICSRESGKVKRQNPFQIHMKTELSASWALWNFGIRPKRTTRCRRTQRCHSMTLERYIEEKNSRLRPTCRLFLEMNSMKLFFESLENSVDAVEFPPTHFSTLLKAIFLAATTQTVADESNFLLR